MTGKQRHAARRYLFAIAMAQTVKWLLAALAYPNGHETPLSVACIKLALRKKSGA